MTLGKTNKWSSLSPKELGVEQVAGGHLEVTSQPVEGQADRPSSIPCPHHHSLLLAQAKDQGGWPGREPGKLQMLQE